MGQERAFTLPQGQQISSGPGNRLPGHSFLSDRLSEKFRQVFIQTQTTMLRLPNSRFLDLRRQSNPMCHSLSLFQGFSFTNAPALTIPREFETMIPPIPT